jgi:hypothetical protein
MRRSVPENAQNEKSEFKLNGLGRIKAKLGQQARKYRQIFIVGYFRCRITQGAVEAINGIIQLAKTPRSWVPQFLFSTHRCLSGRSKTQISAPIPITHLKQRGQRILQSHLVAPVAAATRSSSAAK